MEVAAIVPSLGYAPQLPALLDTLSASGVHTTIPVNVESRFNEVVELVGPSRSTVVVGHFGESLYSVWNRELDHAEEVGLYDVVLVLNDDITLADGAVEAVVDAMRRNPSYGVIGFDYENSPRPFRLRPAHGTYRTGGVGCFAFAIRADLGVRVDERFVWWGGDDDLILKTLRKGFKVAVAEGAGVHHPVSGTSSAQRPEVLLETARDREVFVELWGESLAW